MRRINAALKFIIPAAFLIVSAFSCDDKTKSPADYGTKPSPETTFCDPEGVEAYLQWAADSYPAVTSVRDIGRTVGGRSIFAIEISDNPGTAEAEPAILIGGAIHGHEQASAGTVLKLIEYLLASYEAGDDEAVDLVKNYKLHFIPAINPDGLAHSRRYNDNGVDINRNFGYNWAEEENYNGDAAFDQPESRAIRDDFMKYGYSLALVLHTASSHSGMGIYGPWDAIPIGNDPEGEADFIAEYLPNYEMISSIGSNYSDNLTSTADYPFNNFFHYQEGADWYVLYGSVNDWALGTVGTGCYSVELYGKQNYSILDYLLLQEIWEANKNPMLNFIPKSSLGTGGQLIDSDGNSIAGASISLAAGSASRSFTAKPYTELHGITDINGRFRFLTEAGDYHISFTSDEDSLDADITVDSEGNTSIEDSTAEFYPQYQLE